MSARRSATDLKTGRCFASHSSVISGIFSSWILEDGHRRVDGHARLVALGVEVRAVEAEGLLLARLHADDFPVKALGHEALAAHVGLRCCAQAGDSRAVFLEASHADEDAVSRAHLVLLGSGRVLGVLLGNLCDLLVDKRLVDAEGLRGNTHGLIRRELVALLREHLEREGGRLAPLQLVRAFHAGWIGGEYSAFVDGERHERLEGGLTHDGVEVFDAELLLRGCGRCRDCACDRPASYWPYT